jgi:outer membrane cobalamin receptor
LFESESWQSGGRVDLTRELSATHQLQAGLLVRRLSGRVDDTSYSRTGPVIVRSFDRAQWQPGGYVQDGWQSSSRRAAFTAGLRVDRSGASARTVALPRASGLVSLSSRDTMSFAAGSFAQFPSLDQLFGASGNPDLVPEASHHFVIGLEHLLSSASRVRVDLYDQEERHRLDLGGSEIRRVNGRLFLPDQRLLHNSWSGRSKGVEMTVQRRSPNGMTGWLSYAYGRTRLRDSITQSEFDSDHDQKHTVNAYLSYRIGDRTNFSLKYRFGSNTPIAGYFEETSIGFQVSDQRNLLRIPAYSRLDVRANRTFSIRRARLTGYAEVINLLNHSNYRYSGASVQGPSGLTFFDRETTFPFLPAAGITVEW